MSVVVDSTSRTTAPARRSLLPSAAELSLARVARGLFRLAILFIGARVLGPDQFGSYALLLTVNEILLFVSGGGFIDYLTREGARDLAQGYRSAVRLTQLRWLYLAGLIALSLPVLWLLRYPHAILVDSILLSSALFPRAINESGKGLLRAARAFRRFLWVELAEGATLVGFGSILLLRGIGIRGLIWAELAAALVGAMIAFRLMVPLLPTRSTATMPAWREGIRKTIAFNIYPLIVDVYDRIDIVLLSKLAGNVAVGLYVMPYRILPMLQVLPYGLMGVLLPTLSAGKPNGGDKETSSQALGLLYASALLFILGAMLLSETGIAFALGPRYQGSATALQILIWATLPMFMNNVYNTILLARNRERFFLLTSTVCMLVNITANLILIPHYSYRAAAAVTILTELVLLAQNLVLVKRTLGYVPLPKNVLRNSLAFAVVAGLSMVGLQWASALVVGGLATAAFAIFLYSVGTFEFSHHEDIAVSRA